MKSFFNEYGKIIVTAVVTISLIAVAVALRVPVQNNLENMVGDWANSTTSITLTVEGVNVGGGSGGSSIDMSNINISDGTTTLAAGDFSAKGNLVTINDTQYRVLEINGTQAKIMSMDDLISSKFNSSSVTTDFNGTNGQKYADSTLDVAMNTYYNSLPLAIQNAIVEQNINQSMYSWTITNPGNANFSAFYSSYFTESTASGTNYYLTRITGINVGNRKVYALDIDDVIAYLGPNSTPQDVNEMFWGQRSAMPSGAIVWLRSAISDSDYGNNAFSVYGINGFIDYRYKCTSSCKVRPAFVIDLALLS